MVSIVTGGGSLAPLKARNAATGEVVDLAVDAAGRLITSETDTDAAILIELRTLTALTAAIGSGQVVASDDHEALREVPVE